MTLTACLVIIGVAQVVESVGSAGPCHGCFLAGTQGTFVRLHLPWMTSNAWQICISFEREACRASRMTIAVVLGLSSACL